MLRGLWLWSDQGVRLATTLSIAVGISSSWVAGKVVLLPPFPPSGHFISMKTYKTEELTPGC